jgi:hypothetical protein
LRKTYPSAEAVAVDDPEATSLILEALFEIRSSVREIRQYLLDDEEEEEEDT